MDERVEEGWEEESKKEEERRREEWSEVKR